VGTCGHVAPGHRRQRVIVLRADGDGLYRLVVPEGRVSAPDISHDGDLHLGGSGLTAVVNGGRYLNAVALVGGQGSYRYWQDHKVRKLQGQAGQGHVDLLPGVSRCHIGIGLEGDTGAVHEQGSGGVLVCNGHLVGESRVGVGVLGAQHLREEGYLGLALVVCHFVGAGVLVQVLEDLAGRIVLNTRRGVVVRGRSRALYHGAYDRPIYRERLDVGYRDVGPTVDVDRGAERDIYPNAINREELS